MEDTRRVKILEQFHAETGRLEQSPERVAIVENFVVVGAGAATADADPFDVSRIGMVSVGNGDAQVAPRPQEAKTVPGGGRALLDREMLPDVLGQDGVDRALDKQAPPAVGIQHVEDV